MDQLVFRKPLKAHISESSFSKTNIMPPVSQRLGILYILLSSESLPLKYRLEYNKYLIYALGNIYMCSFTVEVKT